MATPVLHTAQLAIGYPSKTVATAIDIDLYAGELVGIIGINGAGKSTLLRTLAGLQPSLSGNIYLNQQSITSLSEEALARERSVVLTNQTISKNLCVEELVALGRQPYTNWLGTLSPIDHKHIAEACDLTDLCHLRDRPLDTLSDGQLQRALIARAVAQESKLLFLDEPLSHLDLHHQASVIRLLKNLSNQGKAVVFTTHNIDFAIAQCSKIGILQEGTIIQGTPQSLIDQGAFNGLFPSDQITFDSTTRRFKIVD